MGGVGHSNIERSGLGIIWFLAIFNFEFGGFNLKLPQRTKSLDYHSHQINDQTYNLKSTS